MAEDYIQRAPYPLKKSEETNQINNINELLNNLENILKVNSNEMNDVKIIQSSAICELMLNLLLKRKQYSIRKDTPLSHLIDFSKNNRIIPNQCINFLELIKGYRNQPSHDAASSRRFTSTFLNAFMNYISWFNLNYPSKNRFDIDGCCSIIYSKSSFANDDRRFYSIYDDIHGHFDERINTFECPHCRFTLAKGDNYCPNCGSRIESDTIETKIANKINEFRDRYLNSESNQKEETAQKEYTPNFNQEEILNDLNRQNREIKRILEMMNETVEKMDEKLDTIIGQLDLVQSHTEKLMKTAVTEDEIDRIIEVHTTQCVESIIEHQKNMVMNENYHVEKRNLVELFGLDSWKKLSEDSKTFLITSKFMYNHLSQLNENFDYSGICVLITKALEVEIFKRFFTDFLKYLNEKYHNDYSRYHTALLHRNFKPLFPERFTMGNIAYVLCYKQKRTDTENEKVNNRIILLEYCKDRLFSNYSEKEILSTLNYYGEKIELIKDKFRNPSAHRDQIKRVDAGECIDLIIDVEKLLKQMLDSFDY